MKAEEARAQLQAGNLIDRKTSKAVLTSIVRDEPCNISLPPELLPHISALRVGYRNMRQKINDGPRNHPFYLMIKERHSDFDWTPTDKGVTIDFKYRDIKPSLLSLLVGRVPVEQAREKRPFDRLPASIGSSVRRLWKQVGLVTTNTEEETLFVDWLLKGLDGKELTIVSPVCPDYAVEPIDDTASPGRCPFAARRHRFTFKDLGTGIGVTAAHLFRALPALRGFFVDELGLRVSHLVCPGDFEGFSHETCVRLGIDEETFKARIIQSAKTIAMSAPVPVNAPLFTDLCGGREGWTVLYEGTHPA